MTRKIIAAIKSQFVPPLYSQEYTDDPIVYAEITVPKAAGWRWFVLEAEDRGNGEDMLFFGYVSGDALELGYFRLSDILTFGAPLKLTFYIEPLPYSEVKTIELL